jgi:diacylglycerol kinase
MMAFFQSRIRSFGYAFSGWVHVIRTQRNAWIHALITMMALGVAAWLELSLQEWAILILTIALVWTAEFINTAIEAVVDLAVQEHHPLAKIGKDVGAAAVLIAAIAAIVVGLLLFGPPLWARVSTIF